MVHKKANGEWGEGQQLTVISVEWTASLGMAWSGRCGEGDLGWPEVKTTMVVAMQRVPGRLAGRGRCRRRGGAPVHEERARGRRWLRGQ